MRCSVVMSTRNKAEPHLFDTLKSIRDQEVPFEYEIVIADDGSTDNTKQVCEKFGVEKYIFIENDTYRNPSVARNVAFKAAEGEIFVHQSDDVLHVNYDTIQMLCNRLHVGEFLIATVFNYDMETKTRLEMYTGLQNQRPFFFLGSLWRKDVYAVGGYDEEFVDPAFDDDWFAICLKKGLGLKVRYLTEVLGLHQNHWRPNLMESVRRSFEVYQSKIKKGVFISSSGVWDDT